jgi:DNA-binding MarR family transcriptional regulator
MADPTPSDPRPELFGSLLVLVQHLARRLDDALLPLGLTSRQWLLLAVLDRWFRGRSPSLTEAAARYGSSRQNVKQLALGLERRGYLRLVLDSGDRRTTRLVVTDKVRVFEAPEAAERGAALLRAAFADIGDAELEQLHALVSDWLAAVHERLGEGPAEASAPGAPS